MTARLWTNDHTTLFDLTDREYPRYAHLVFVRSILMKKGKRAIVTISAPMPNEWLWNFQATTLEVLLGWCSDPRAYEKRKQIIELSNCQETHRWIKNLMVLSAQDVEVVELVLSIECDVNVIFDERPAQ